jgi:serine/threonine protein kinase
MSEHSEALEPVAFGKYLLDEELARGGMSRVFRARLRGPGGFEKRLVVKQILPELAADPEFIKLFVKEANTLVQLSHPNLVPVFELGVVDDVYFLAMEWVQGATVDELLRQGPLPAALVAQIGSQIADALHYAHERFSIVHRDVTPRNVIVDATGYARLLDFGIAARVEHTGSGELFGSPGYMAPEQLRGEGLSPASDLFSLGCVLYEAISGKPAWPPLRSASELDASPAPAALMLTDVPLRELISGLIERDPKARPQPAGHVAERLRAWLSEHHPRGLLNDLAERVAKSRAHSAEKPREAQEPPRVSSGRIEVRSIAVSPELTALLGQATEKIARLPTTPAADNGDDDNKISRAPETMAEDPELHRIARRLLRDAVVITFALFIALLWPRKDDEPEEVAKKLPRGTTPTTAIAPEAEEHAAPNASPGVAPVNQVAPNAAGAAAESSNATSAAAANSAAEQVAADNKPEDEAADAPQKRGFLSVSAVPWAEVRVDGRLLGATPRRSVPLRAGKHSINLSCPPLAHETTLTVELQPEQELRVTANMHESPPEVTTQ